MHWAGSVCAQTRGGSYRAGWNWPHTLSHTHTHTLSHIQTHELTHTRTDRHTLTLTHIHTHTHIYTHTHTHTPTHTQGLEHAGQVPNGHMSSEAVAALENAGSQQQQQQQQEQEQEQHANGFGSCKAELGTETGHATSAAWQGSSGCSPQGSGYHDGRGGPANMAAAHGTRGNGWGAGGGSLGQARLESEAVVLALDALELCVLHAHARQRYQQQQQQQEQQFPGVGKGMGSAREGEGGPGPALEMLHDMCSFVLTCCAAGLQQPSPAPTAAAQQAQQAQQAQHGGTALICHSLPHRSAFSDLLIRNRKMK